jgi:hypothetical protein
MNNTTCRLRLNKNYIKNYKISYLHSYKNELIYFYEQDEQKYKLGELSHG